MVVNRVVEERSVEEMEHKRISCLGETPQFIDLMIGDSFVTYWLWEGELPVSIGERLSGFHCWNNASLLTSPEAQLRYFLLSPPYCVYLNDPSCRCRRGRRIAEFCSRYVGEQSHSGNRTMIALHLGRT